MCVCVYYASVCMYVYICAYVFSYAMYVCKYVYVLCVVKNQFRYQLLAFLSPILFFCFIEHWNFARVAAVALNFYIKIIIKWPLHWYDVCL